MGLPFSNKSGKFNKSCSGGSKISEKKELAKFLECCTNHFVNMMLFQEPGTFQI